MIDRTENTEAIGMYLSQKQISKLLLSHFRKEIVSH